jgi:hypothetical protein
MAAVGALGHPGNRLSNPYRTRDLCPLHRFKSKKRLLLTKGGRRSSGPARQRSWVSNSKFGPKLTHLHNPAYYAIATFLIA